MVLVALQACTDSNQETVSEAVQSKENFRDIAYDAYIYAYPPMEQVKTVNGMVEFLGLQRNKAAMNTKLPYESVGMPIVAPNLTSMTGGMLIDISDGPVSLEIPEVKDRNIRVANHVRRQDLVVHAVRNPKRLKESRHRPYLAKSSCIIVGKI